MCILLVAVLQAKEFILQCVCCSDMIKFSTVSNDVVSILLSLTIFPYLQPSGSSGVVHYSNLSVHEGDKAYTLRVEGTTADGRQHTIRRKLRIG